MGFLDAASGFLSTIGGAYTDGGLQNLLNQCSIPGTIVMSYFFLGETVNKSQGLGSTAIVLGTAVSVLPAILNPNLHSATTVTGVLIYLCGIIPTSASNVYKEAAFRTGNDLHVDIYLLSALVAVFQVIFGFMFIPILALPGFGGIPLAEIPNQLRYGFYCFLGQNSLPGDHCGYTNHWFQGSTAAMLIYCVINFGYNVLSLLVTKYGSATLMVVSAALALPITNLAFSWKFLMGDYVESFSDADVAALVIVVFGFLVYSSDGIGLSTSDESTRTRLLPIVPRGSVAYLTRSNSDPNMFWSPAFTPKISSTRFGRYSPSSRLMRNSPALNKTRAEFNGTSPEQNLPVQYNALSTTPPLHISVLKGGDDDYALEMRPGYE
eukprot:CAMPEP_0114363230 /NCGR_PEP_ID=MMETSP0101-20121206/26395_1 /TAXON_ID=38822 ORGANISM="Pteridomonas danica, Strain PT" /NCGR_SAMPLE_ID=MMETSP0101 /ASSEMBLY_ACC=CAM_ASM_000211 /LENGTH=378 /DNA_ID=CAMNT_0001509737 /DNA_START=312 /DNA_END=1445 /DNA_ORIENTATION=+